MNLEASIRADMIGVGPGESRRQVCPFCEAKHEKSFNMWRSPDRPHLIYFVCYRGTCAQHGYVVDKLNARMVLTQDDVSPIPLKLAEHRHPSPEFLQTVASKYHISPDYLQAQGVRYGDGDALCMPWRNEDGTQVGWVEKRFDRAWFKSHHDLTDKSSGRLGFPRIYTSYYTLAVGRVCVLVESLLDAYRVNDYADLAGSCVTSVALLGADLSSRDALRLSTLFSYVMVCLDPDQWPKGAMRVVKRFAGMPVVVHATTLAWDPKDATDDELEDLFTRCREMPSA